MILGVFSELNGVGGIQQVSRHAGATLLELAGRKGDVCELAGLNDPEGEAWFQVGERQFRFRGFGRNKVKLVAYMMARAARTRLLFAGHIYFGPPSLAAATLGPHLRYWLVAHGFEVWQPLPLYRAVSLRRAHGVIAVSRNTAEAVEREQRVPREKIAVLPPALEPDCSGAMPEEVREGLPSGSRMLLSVARLSASEPGKGIDTVIRALPGLLHLFPDLYYVIVGDGDARPMLQKLAAEIGVAQKVIFAGQRSRKSLRGFYEMADVFVMPSRQEGFGIVFLEAMAAGKPVVASPCGGAQEVVSAGKDGFFVNYEDVSGLTARLTELLKDDQLRRQMGEAGQRKAEEHRFEIFRERLISLLDASIAIGRKCAVDRS